MLKYVWTKFEVLTPYISWDTVHFVEILTAHPKIANALLWLLYGLYMGENTFWENLSKVLWCFYDDLSVKKWISQLKSKFLKMYSLCLEHCSSNYCIPYLDKPVHVHAKLDGLVETGLFVVWQTILVLYGDTSASQMKAKQFARYANKQYLLVDEKRQDY